MLALVVCTTILLKPLLTYVQLLQYLQTKWLENLFENSSVILVSAYCSAQTDIGKQERVYCNWCAER